MYLRSIGVIALSCLVSLSAVAENFIPVGEAPEVQDVFLKEIEAVIGSANLPAWTFRMNDRDISERGREGFRQVFVEGFSKLEARGKAKAPVGSINAQIFIERLAGDDPIKFSVLVRGYIFGKLVKQETETISIPANSTPSRTIALIRASVQSLKQKTDIAFQDLKGEDEPKDWIWSIPRGRMPASE